MHTIFASKLYKASSRKDGIKAALLAPGNLSLVQQLAESLDEEYQTPSNLGKEDNKEEKSNKDVDDLDSIIVDEEIDPEKDLMTVDDAEKSSKKLGTGSRKPAPRSAGGGAHKPELKDMPEEKDHKDADTSELIPDSPANEKPEKPEKTETDASTKIESATLSDLNIIKGTLNNREDTHGVQRVAEKEDEVWIYYNDEINLNNVMTEVIECLAECGYSTLEFNRLARSDNAIVFTTMESTYVEPESKEDNE